MIESTRKLIFAIVLLAAAGIAGNWSWDLAIAGQRIAYAAVLEQHFQAAEDVVRAGANREVLTDVKLSGENLSFNLGLTLDGIGFTRHDFSGKVRGERIERTVRLALSEKPPLQLPWRALRTAASGYFAPRTLTCHEGSDRRETGDHGFAWLSMSAIFIDIK